MLSHRYAPRILTVAVLLGSLAVAPAFAADTTAKAGTTPPAKVNTVKTVKTDTAAPANMHMHHKHHMSVEDMHKHVEERITTLHTKLNITPDQESAWSEVANAMRESEKETAALIQVRHENADARTAIEDLQSYQKIAQSHADGLKNVITAFSSLYDSMPDDQKKTADTVFGSFEGHMHGEHATMKPVGK